MEGYIDIHCHVLPGADDGAKNIKCALDMLRMADRNGITHMIATPHQKEGRRCISPQRMKEAVAELQAEAEIQKLGIKLYCGNELFYRRGLSRLVEEGDVCTLADSAYVLVEFSPVDEFSYIRNGIYEMLSSGFYPVIAHVERYQCLFKKKEYLEELVRMGGYVQVNAGSILGELGMGVKRFVNGLLRDHLVHFVASDAHDTGKRGIGIAECAKRLERKYGAEYADELFRSNAQAVLENIILS